MSNVSMTIRLAGTKTLDNRTTRLLRMTASLHERTDTSLTSCLNYAGRG